MAAFFSHWRDVFYDLFVPIFFFSLTIILRAMMRIRVVSGTDALAILGTIDWAASGGKIDFVRLFALDTSNDGIREIIFALMLACVLGMIISVWFESILEEWQPRLTKSISAAHTRAEQFRHLAALVGIYLLAYIPAMFVVMMHVGLLMTGRPV